MNVKIVAFISNEEGEEEKKLFDARERKKIDVIKWWKNKFLL